MNSYTIFILMSFLDEAKARVTAGIMYVVNGSRENCLLKGLLSGVMGTDDI